MRIFKKIVSASLLLALAATLALSLTSCHGGSSLAEFTVPEEGIDPEKKYEITFWAKNDSNKTQTDIYRKAISDFEALYPNIKVTLVSYTNYQDIYKNVIINIPTATTPNVCISYPDHVATYLSGNNLMVPLDGLMSDGRYGLGGSELKFDGVKSEEIVPEFLEEGKIGGVQYLLPFMRSTEACYINKTYVESLGYEIPEVLTWDFIWEVSNAAMAKNADGTFKVNGQNTLIPFIYKSTDNMMIQMLAQKNAPYSTPEGEIKIFDSPECEEILYKINSEAAKETFDTFKNVSYPGDYFNRGQCLFAIDSTAGATWMGTDAPHLDIDEDETVEFETVVKEIPQFNTDAPKMISQGPSVCVFNKRDSDEVLASWLFCQFLLTNSVQIPYSETEGYAPVTLKAQESEEYLDYLSRSGEAHEDALYYPIKIEATKLLLRNTENTFVTPVFNGSTNLRNAAGQLIEEVTVAPRRGKTVDDKYLSDLYDRMRTNYKLGEADIIDESGAKKDLGPMPPASIALISVLAVTDVSLIVIAVAGKIKKRKK